MQLLRIALSVVLFAAFACGLGFGQENDVPQRVYFHMPDGTRPENVFIRYQIIREKGGEGDIVRPQAGVPPFSFPIASQLGDKPRLVNIVAYVPGCQFQIYVIEVSGSEDPTIQFHCEPLATRHISATMPKSEIPVNIFRERDTRVDVMGYFDGEWICSYFLRPLPTSKGIQGGSCLSAQVALGVVGTIDPANEGSFALDIPDFSRDPTFKEFSTERYGAIDLVLRDRTTGRPTATLKRKGGGEGSHLKIPPDYPQPMEFTVRSDRQ